VSWQDLHLASYIFLAADSDAFLPAQAAGAACEPPQLMQMALILVDLLSNSQNLGYGFEGLTAKIHIEAGNDHSHTAIGQLLTHLHDGFVEELRLINSNYPRVVVNFFEDLPGALNRNGQNPGGIMTL